MKKIFFIGFLATSLSLTAQETDENIHLEEVIVTAQGREERMLVVPITMNSLSSGFLQTTNTTDLTQLSNFVPGLNIRIQTPHRPTFVIRGLTSDEVSPTAQPRVSTYFNNAPISRASMAKSNLFDMERVEVVKGPQGTLFGRGAQIGGIHFITRKPTSDLGGYVGAGIGNFGMAEIEGVLNVPVIDNKLMFRMGGSHQIRDGYVENLSSDNTLGNVNSTDLRFSARYLPKTNFRIDLTIDYQNDKDNGTPFMSKRFPNTNGVIDIFGRKASFDPGKDFYNKRELLGTILDMNYFINSRNSITSLTSFHHNWVNSRWDGDGTQASAIDMDETVKANQFTQEFRWNFTQDRFKGFLGTSYWREDVRQTYGFMPNEQYLAWLLMDMFPGMEGMGNMMILPDGTPNPMPALAPEMTGQPFPTPLPGEGARRELRNSSAVNSAFDLFVNFDYSLTDRLIFTAGIRGTFERLSFSNYVDAVEGSAPSMLAMLTQQPGPNFLFAVHPLIENSKNYFSGTYRANLKYLINNNTTVFGGYARGRRPNVLQGNADGTVDELNAETVDNFEIGFKYFDRGRFSFDAGLFYYLYNNFQAATMQGMRYIIIDAGKAQSYGIELNASVDICRHLDLFGNYAYIRARFNDDDSQSIFAGNRFRLTPDHNFTLGLNAKAKLGRNVGVVFTPTYSYRSEVYFEDDNNPELTQDGYGLLNLNLGFNFVQQGLNVSLFAHNVTNERYIISAGNTGQMFGVPTFVPGMPSTFGMRARWNF